MALSSWITLIASSVLLILLGCSNSLVVRGVFIDAEEPDGKCVVLPCYYFRLIFQSEKVKKINKKAMQAAQQKKHEGHDNHVMSIETISTIVEENNKSDNYNSPVSVFFISSFQKTDHLLHLGISHCFRYDTSHLTPQNVHILIRS